MCSKLPSTSVVVLGYNWEEGRKRWMVAVAVLVVLQDAIFAPCAFYGYQYHPVELFAVGGNNGRQGEGLAASF